ncbi:MAG: OsmC family protein [Curvibacter sp.]|nr:OsmC family protein [Curvibacter sp.]
MARHTATVTWQDQGSSFTQRRYSRRHAWHFDGGVTVPASSSPSVVPLPYSDAAAVDPEEAFVAALSSCHMLWFLDLAAQDGWQVRQYRDEAVGRMAADGQGRLVMAQVTLQPLTRFADPQPSQAQLEALHHRAHEACFLANSVKTEIRCEPALDLTGGVS